MGEDLIKVGGYLISLSSICDAHWEQLRGESVLIVHYAGSHWVGLPREAGEQLWKVLEARSMDVGEMLARA